MSMLPWMRDHGQRDRMGVGRRKEVHREANSSQTMGEGHPGEQENTQKIPHFKIDAIHDSGIYRISTLA